MRKIITTLSLLLFMNLCAQESIRFSVLDSVSAKPLPFAKIIFLSKNKGAYADEKGMVAISGLSKDDKLSIVYVGYDTVSVLCKDIISKGKVWLQPKEYEFKEIDIRSTQFKYFNLGYFKKISNSYWVCSNVGNELAVFIDNPLNSSAIIDKIFFKVKKTQKNNPLLRIHLYENNNNKVGKELFLKNNIVTVKKNMVILEIRDQYIEFPTKGIFVSIEWLGKYSLNNIIYNDTSYILSPKILSTGARRYTAFYRVWSKKWEIFPTESIPVPAIGVKIEVYSE